MQWRVAWVGCHECNGGWRGWGDMSGMEGGVGAVSCW